MFQKNLSSHFLDFQKSTESKKLPKNYNGSDLKKKSRSWDREKENQQNSNSLKTQLQDAFWRYLKQIVTKIVFNCRLFTMMMQKVWFEMFLRFTPDQLHAEFFCSCIFYLPYTRVYGTGISIKKLIENAWRQVHKILYQDTLIW